ncbi:Cna B-type domain-containing protein [Vagococcus bubulae]|nr:Cna B-type domain-containing protein [Vagococcus bubulae]
MKKITIFLLLLVGILFTVPKTQVEASKLPDEPKKNVRLDINLKDNPDVHLNNINLMPSRLYTLTDDDQNIYFCLDEGKYYPNNVDYTLDTSKKLSGPVLWLMQNYFTNIDKNVPVKNVPDYQSANNLTRYTATQIAIWKLTGANFKDIIIESNPLIQQLYEEAKDKTTDGDSYQQTIEKIDNIEINVKDIIPNGEDENNYYYKMTFQDNIDAETEKLIQIDDNDTNIDVHLLKNGKTTDITKDVKTESNFATRTISLTIPKKIIDEDKSPDTELYCNIDTIVRSKEPYYVVYYAKPIVQPIGTLQPIEKRLVTRASIDFDGTETSFSVLKHWEDQDNQDGLRPQKLAVQLYQSDKPYQFSKNESITTGNESKFEELKYLDESNDWEYIWGNLPVKNDEGQPVYYTVREEFDSKDYELTIQATDEGKALLLKNKHKVEEVVIEGEKVWNDSNNQDGVRPNAVTIELFANGKSVMKQEVSEQNNWKFQFKGLPKYENGKEIVYTAKEINVPKGYNSTINNDENGNIVITNSHEPEKTEISGKKTWNDANNQDGKRPKSIKVNLLANGVKVDSKTVTEKDNWAYTFSDLDKYENGEPIVYTVNEDSVPDYTVSIKGNDIINSYIPGKTSVTVSKHWNDSNNQDGIRPQDISVQLYADGKESGKPVTLNEENKWQHTWKELDEKKDGKTIEYTVKEINVPKGYNSTITNNENGNILITNSHEPEKTEISGKKTWNDANNQDGKRPESIKVNLLANGVKVDSKTVTEKDNWAYTFSDLDKYENGEPIVYTVNEDSVPDYTVSIKDNDITNSYTPGKTSITVSKHWSDLNNQDGIRPQDISVQLYADGKELGKPVTLNEGNKWQYTWKELAEKKNGKAVEYTVKEINVPKGYTATVSDDGKGHITLTNSHNVSKEPGTNGSGTTPNNNNNPNLPSTGEARSMSPIFYGTGILLMSMGAFYIRRKH